MQPSLCTRCKKYMAVVFITKLENGKSTNEGLCLKCSKELGIKPVDDILRRMNISEDDLDTVSGEMFEAFTNAGELFGFSDVTRQDDDGEDDEGKTATFPFLHRLFSSTREDGPQRDDAAPRENAGGRPPRDNADGPRSGAAEGAARTERDGQRADGTRASERDKRRKYLENYCISLTRRAKEGKLDRIVGRENEIERVLQILNRRQKNNPCLIGEPGVGKTAIAEGLAQRIADGGVPAKLLSKEVYLLDLTALVAGTQFRGQFESRMKGLIEEIRKLGNIVLVIDEVHNLVGAGDAEGSMNAANILKPALSRGEIQVIGATTFNEYRKHIEKDAALERRFQPVTISEPSVSETVEVLRGIAHYYEAFHGVRIPESVSAAAVRMSERYITDRFLPDKAIDLIDEACSDVNLKTPAIAEMESIRIQLESLRAEYGSLREQVSAQAYERMAKLKSEEMRLEQRHAELLRDGAPELTVEHLAYIIEKWTGIPALQIQELEYERLSRLEERLKKRIAGQDEAVAAVSAAIRRGRVGLSAKPKPVSFIFVGPTGVGKTELVKCLAQDLFDEPEALIRLDMSEFMEKHSVSRIVGAPPGYVGYDEAGQLTEKVRRKPYSVVLFDELEKAHPEVLNVLLQILDDGHITDAQGRKVSFVNTVIIMTSNAGSDKSSGLVGFTQSEASLTKERALKSLQDVVRPEFLNRIDEVVAFAPLGKDSFGRIAHIMLGDLAAAMSGSGITFTYDDALVAHLVEKSFSVKFGARNLRRVLQKEVEDAIAGLIIDHYSEAISRIHATVMDGKALLSYN